MAISNFLDPSLIRQETLRADKDFKHARNTLYTHIALDIILSVGVFLTTSIVFKITCCLLIGVNTFFLIKQASLYNVIKKFKDATDQLNRL